MRIFLAGGTGAIGRRLIPVLLSRGHQVTATTRTPHKLDDLRKLGTDAIVMDALDPESVRSAILSTHPELIVHQMTALTGAMNVRKFDEFLATTNQLRTIGTQHLLDAAQAAHVPAMLAQSYIVWPNSNNVRAASEEAPRHANPPQSMHKTLEATAQLEETVTTVSHLNGVVLRYGSFYGPGTAFGPGGQIAELVSGRKFPLVGDGNGVWSFIHVDDAAEATALAIDRGVRGLYNIADDEPAPVSEWLPALASALNADPPRRVPAILARMMIGEAGISMMTDSRGVSNAKAKRDLGWRLKYPSWQDGFRSGME
jgi:nucleoside-diphosphate-sugar epimerase